jgi:putative hydrolase of the HAD superfamily
VRAVDYGCRVTVEAVIFDWGGTLTPWITQDGRGWWRIAAKLVAAADVDRIATALFEAEVELWRRSRDLHTSGTLAEVFSAAGLIAEEDAYTAHDAEWEPSTFIDPHAPAMLAGLRDRGLRVGVLSNTIWPRSRHQQIFVRDGVDHLFDGAVYTSEIAWTKPHPEAFLAAMAAIGVTEPRSCVFVGDRPFDDIFGAQRVGMRTVLVPHSDIPTVQHGHTQGRADAVIATLADLLPVIDGWRVTPR